MPTAEAICTCKICGNTFVKTAVKNSNREARYWERIQVLTSTVCPDCERKQREETTQKAAAQAKELGWPELTGSDKQIAWAERIRVEFSQKIDEKIEHRQEEVQYIDESIEERRAKGMPVETKIERRDRHTTRIAELREFRDEMLAAQSGASWWIDFGRDDPEDLMLRMNQRQMRERAAAKAPEKEDA